MRSNICGAIGMIFVSTMATVSMAQGPLERILDGTGPGNLSRMPDDQIEGTVWEYKATLKEETRRAKLKKKKAETSNEKQGDAQPKENNGAEKVNELQGKFRTEGDAIFDLNRRLKLPKKKEIEQDIQKFKDGELEEIKLPSRSSPKRIGQYHRLRGGKLKLEFDDEDSLHGMMIIKKRKKTSDVWIGSYHEMEGKKRIRTWQVEVRPIED